MERTMKRRKLSFIIAFAVFLLLASNFSVTYASPATNTTLPDFLERLLAQYSKEVSPSELNRIRTQWAEQIKRNEEVKAKGGDVLDLSSSGAYLATIEATSPPKPYGYIHTLNIW